MAVMRESSTKPDSDVESTMTEEASRILVVDDDRLNIAVVAESLRTDYRVMAAMDFNQAMRAIHSPTPPDLILLDIIMPGVDGFEAFRRIREDPALSQIPIIFLTSSGDHETEADCLALGAEDFIAKPIVPDVLRARIRTQIRLRQQTVALEAAYETIKIQKDRMERELNLGRDLQYGLLPAMPTTDKRFSIAAKMISALEVSGDFYDVFFLDQDHLCFCIGDVSDKGVPAALFMSMSKSLIRSKAEHHCSTAEIVSEVNQAILQYNQACMFVTMVLAILDARTGELTWTNAGHCHPFLIVDGEVTRLTQRHGVPVGISTATYGEDTLKLPKGGSLFFYTDGASEAQDADWHLFGEDGLDAALSSNAGLTVDEIIDVATSAVSTFQDGVDKADDMTLVAMEYRGDDLPRVLALDEAELVPGVQGDRLRAFLSSCDLAEWQRRTIDLVLDELLTNVAKFGKHANSRLNVSVTLITEPDKIELCVSDNGVKFNLLDATSADTESSLEDRNVGGLGIHLCRQLMDQITYEWKDSRNLLRLTKRVQPTYKMTTSTAHYA